jgi:hypothetical protein
MGVCRSTIYIVKNGVDSGQVTTERNKSPLFISCELYNDCYVVLLLVQEKERLGVFYLEMILF